MEYTLDCSMFQFPSFKMRKESHPKGLKGSNEGGFPDYFCIGVMNSKGTDGDLLIR